MGFHEKISVVISWCKFTPNMDPWFQRENWIRFWSQSYVNYQTQITIHESKSLLLIAFQYHVWITLGVNFGVKLHQTLWQRLAKKRQLQAKPRLTRESSSVGEYLTKKEKDVIFFICRHSGMPKFAFGPNEMPKSSHLGDLIA